VKPEPVPGGKIVQAILITRTLPVYPALARQRAIAGAVRLTATIDEHGNVNNVKIVSGDVLLGAAAKNALLTWKYKPATLNGRPIATPTEIEIVFGDRNK
jgi:protein TonB